MLVLQRKVNEIITIGDSIEVQVVRVKEDGSVRLGITAPREIPVHRKEVWAAIQREQEAATEG